MNLESGEDTMNSILGRCLVGWRVCDGGMHFTLDDGRLVIFSGDFVIAIYSSEDAVVH